MARIYNPEQYGDNFQGSIQSRGFNPVTAIDRSDQERQKAKQAVDNINREIDILGRDQQMEKTFQSASQNVENANRQATSTVIQGLLSLSKTAVEARKVQLEETKRVEKENSTLNSMGFTQEGLEPNKVDFDNAKDLDTAINAEASAIDQTATEVEAGGTLEDRDVAHQLRQGSAHNIAAGVKGDLYGARGAHASYLQEAIRLIPDDQKPRSVPEAQALLRNLNRQFYRLSGLFDINKSLVASELGPTILTNNTNTVNQLVTASIKADQTANANQLQSTIYSSVASDMPAEQVWKVTSEGAAHGNVGFTGFSAASNEYGLKKVVEAAIAVGDVALLEGLEVTPKIPGQPNGPKLGDEYAHILGPAITQAKAKRTERIRTNNQAISQQAKDAVQAYYDNPAKGKAKAELIQKLQSLPQTAEVRRELASLTSAGFNNDPEMEADLARRAAAGEHIPQDELKAALDGGHIRPEVYEQHALSHADIKVNAQARSVVEEMKPFIEQTVLGGVKTSDMPATTRTMFNMRVKMFSDELAQQMAAEARSNPAILDNLQERNELAEKIMASLSARPEFTLVVDPQSGVSFAANPGQRSSEVQGLTIAPGEQDFRGISREAILKNVPLSEISATDDLLLSSTSLELDVNNIINGEKVSPTTSSWARSLGMSERAFIDAQLERNGKPSLSLLRSQSPKAAEPGTDLTSESGFQHLQSMGFPVRGSAYITSAISHESAWNGMREWEEVAGDGTNRNGGLISWASWHDNSARLGAIERHFGRSISSITETEQLQYMQHEMKTQYKEAYRIFNNPNASSSDLRWAVADYWGFDPRYTGDRWVDAESLINRS